MRAAFTAGPVLRQPPAVEAVMAAAALAVVRTLTATLEAIGELEAALDARFEPFARSSAAPDCPRPAPVRRVARPCWLE